VHRILAERESLLQFYWCINVGSFFALGEFRSSRNDGALNANASFTSLATTYAEHDVGFWLAYLLPGILYMYVPFQAGPSPGTLPDIYSNRLMPIVLLMVYKKLYKAPPSGSVVVEAAAVFKVLFSRGGWKRALKGGGESFWNGAKPSLNQEASQGTGVVARRGFLAKLKRNSNQPKPWTWDDKFVDELKQSVRACAIFAFIPIFNLMDTGFGSVENAMSAAMV
jgi:POT family proton-dependent oligopeptide transporter